MVTTCLALPLMCNTYVMPRLPSAVHLHCHAPATIHGCSAYVPGCGITHLHIRQPGRRHYLQGFCHLHHAQQPACEEHQEPRREDTLPQVSWLCACSRLAGVAA